MADNTKKKIGSVCILLAVFIIYTLCVKFVDVSPIGPENSEVGFASINGPLHDVIGENEFFYDISKILGLFAFVVGGGFALLALCQVISRKGIFKADADLYALGIFYVLVGIAYVLFEVIIINYRPVMSDEGLEASYPSSHALLGMCIFATAAMQIRNRIKNENTAKLISLILYVLSGLTVISRFISGVHWFTDIVGGVLLGILLIMIYVTIVSYISDIKTKGQIAE